MQLEVNVPEVFEVFKKICLAPEKLFEPRLCGSLGHGSAKMVLETSLPEFNPDKFPLL